jgi:ADP-heptose:LPS heptosyltransferase
LSAAAIRAAPVNELLVVRQHNQMGDMVCALPALHALRNAFPQARLTFVTAPLCEELLTDHPDIDRLLVFRKQDAGQPHRLARFLHALRTPRPDLAVVMTTVSFSTTSTLLCWASGARRRVGASSLPFGSELSRAVFHFELPPGPEVGPEVEHNLAPLRALGIEAPFALPHLAPTTEARAAAAAFLQAEARGAGPLVVVHPGAGKLPNLWPVEHFAATLAVLRDDLDARIVVTEGPRDASIVAALCGLIPAAARWRAPLGSTMGLLHAADVVLSNDTGIAHVAGALGRPTVVVFGPTDVQRWKPPGEHVRAVVSPTGFAADVAVEAVLEAVRAALDPWLHVHARANRSRLP